MSDAQPARDAEQDLASPDQVYARYAQRLCHLAEQHLSQKLAGRIDGEDVVQSVFRTFFRRSARGEFRIDTSADLWRLLVRITVLKARAKARHHTAEARDVAAELPGSQARLMEAAGREPDPADAALLADQIEAVLRGLPPLYGEVLQMRLEGRAVTEIADQLQLSRRTIHRALNLLQQRLLGLTAEVPGEEAASGDR